MATDQQPGSSAAPIDPRLQDPLRQLRGSIRKYVLLEGIALVGTFLALWLWIGLLVDYGLFRLTLWDWVMELPWGVRASVLGGIVLVLVTLVVTRVISLLLGEFSDRSLALVLEKRFPEILGDRLMTAIDLADPATASRYGFSPELVQFTINEATMRVAQLPLNDVFDTVRLRRLIARPFLFLFGGLTVITGGIGIAAGMAGQGNFAIMSQRAMDVATIWGERNLLLQNTPWPRSVQLEVLDFDASGERKVPRDGSAVSIRVRADKWVIADESAFTGWRRIRWAEITPTLLGTAPVSLDPLRDLPLPTMSEGIRLPSDFPKTLEEWSNWPVDRVEQTLLQNLQIRDYVRNKMPADWFASLEQTFEQLTIAGQSPTNFRKFRLLEIPTEVTLESWGVKTSTEMPLRREDNNEFTGTLSELKESVWVRSSAGDAYSPKYRLTLVPPPQLVKLERDELRPAYLYYRPTSDGKAEGLRGLQQIFPNLGISLSGDRSRFEITQGTDFILRGTSDKVLQSVTLLPKAGKYPGIEANDSPLPIPLKLAEDQQSFEVPFQGATRVSRLTEFDLELFDIDNVRSKRAVQIQPMEDKAPEVEVSLEVIRRVGGVYMCTPAAMIPFTPESRVRDDHGLNRVDYRFSYLQLESPGVNSSRTTIAGGVLMLPTLQPNLGTMLHPVVYLREYGKLIKPATNVSLTRFESVDGFAELVKQRKPLTLANLKEVLKKPREANADDPIIHQFDFRSSGQQVFDLQKILPEMEVKVSSQVQPRYRIELSVTATDTNVEAFQPNVKSASVTPEGRVGENREVFNLLVVPEADLLVEISKEEEALAGRLDIILARLRDSQAKLTGIVDTLPTLPQEQMIPTSTRTAEITETVSKSKDMTTDLLKDFERILREYQYNRCSKNILDKVELQICVPLREAMRSDFPAVEDPLLSFNEELGNLRKPEVSVGVRARDALRQLIQRLERVRAGMGEVTDEKKVIAAIQEIIKGQENQIGPQLQRILASASEDLLAPKIIETPAVTVNSLGTTKGKLVIDFGLEFEGEMTLKLEAPANSEIKVPAELKVKSTEEPLTVEFEVKGGTKKGDFAIKVVPSVGRPVTVIVTVK
ncbi:hypothetical protein [Tuwongella immobilis]|uniref:DUF4175 family protein n=1 Tax=Tuwongella immobilis TaxID=692036 RepID=A0A6C2YSM8_9BACT|nr:hypothetical protein [Tuwongella immobilis]VIP03882.1 Putative uncharacterized protein OS=uncultured planctomycete GN=HGMM_F48A06C23 PE=4 SV=1 [Tuwongella immobilis]VTS05131.1 Putative uncharacterized protein OS=uncultured planctomycete GN=HGMM_F48A06C23 PE=4 SV=1 [Tuwongella immobilis]